MPKFGYRFGIGVTRRGAWLLYAPDGWGGYPVRAWRLVWLPGYRLAAWSLKLVRR